MGYVTNYRDATRTVTTTTTGTRTAYKTAYETKTADIGYDPVPIIRPNFTYFSFTGLRPNTPHWIFFDGKNVNKWINTSYNAADYNTIERNNSIRNPGEKYVDSTSFPAELGGPTAASGPVYTDASGNLDGLFYIQSNAITNFKCGNRTLAVIDISVLDKEESLSFAQAEYSAIGEYELYYQYQQEYQQAYEETYQYETSYTESYTESYQTWVDDPVVIPDPVEPIVEDDTPIEVPEDVDPPEDDTPTETTEAITSGSTTTGNSSNDDGGSSNMVLVYNPDDGYNYYMDETHADIRVKDQGWTDKGSGNDDATNGSNNSDTVLCSLLHRRGYLSDDVWKHDAAFGSWVQNNEPEVLDGYHAWAIPMVDWIEEGSLLSKVWFYAWVLPFTSCWAKHIAHKMDPDNHKDNLIGRFMLTIGVPTCRFIGKIMNDKKVKV